MQTIGIIGLGWLGTPLAERLVDEGFTVWGTTRDKNNLRFGQLPSTISLVEWNSGDWSTLEKRLAKTNILIVTLPPSSFEGKSVEILDQLFQNLPTNIRVIYTSSIGAYAEKTGEITEDSQLDEGHKVVQTENLLRRYCANWSILRLGGLIGDKRHPVHFLTKKVNDNPESWVQLITRKDCVEIIYRLVKEKKENYLLNLVNPSLITRKEYYTKVAQDLQIDLPRFLDNQSDTSPRVVKSNIFAELFPDYRFESLYSY